MSELISLRAYARRRRERGLPGGSLQAVQKAIEGKRIRTIDGKIDPEVADIQWERNTDPDQQKRGAGAAALETSTPAAVSAETSHSRSTGTTGADTLAAAGTNGAAVQMFAPPARGEEQVSRIREAARADAARAELLEYELEQKKGNLVRADDVRRAAMEKARIARDALLGIPDRLAPLLAAETDPVKVHSLLAQEMRRVCAELAAGEDKPTRQ